MILEKMMEVFDRYSDHQDKKDKTRSQNRRRHEPVQVNT